jgi:hypothetical protein
VYFSTFLPHVDSINDLHQYLPEAALLQSIRAELAPNSSDEQFDQDEEWCNWRKIPPSVIRSCWVSEPEPLSLAEFKVFLRTCGTDFALLSDEQKLGWWDVFRQCADERK